MNVSTEQAGSHKQFHREFWLRITPKKGKPFFCHPYGCSFDYNAFIKKNDIVEEKDEEGNDTFVCDLDHEAIQHFRKLIRPKETPLMCLYNSTEDYCKNLLGITLSSEDRQWFINHPIPEKEGVPMPNTLRMVQELIDPYGLRVSRVHLTPGISITGDLLQWRSVLGVNPIGFRDRTTSNGEYQAQNPDDPDEYRMDFTAKMLRPSIVCGASIEGLEQGATLGAGGGHAQFNPPRRDPGMKVMSFQIDRAENVPWRVQPKFDPVVPPEEKDMIVFSLDSWYEWDKKQRTNEHWWQRGSGNGEGTRFRESRSSGGRNNTPSKKPSGKELQLAERVAYQLPYCQICRAFEGCVSPSHKGLLVKMPNVGLTPMPMEPPGICVLCWQDLMSEVVCNSKQMNKSCIEGTRGFRFLMFSDDELKVVCMGCYHPFVIKRTENPKVVGRAVTAIFRAQAEFKTGERIKENPNKVEPVVEAPKALPVVAGTSTIPQPDGGETDFFGGTFPISPEQPQQIH